MKKITILFCLVYTTTSLVSQVYVSRNQMMATAKNYLNFTFNATTSNIWAGTTCGGKDVWTPSSVSTVTTNTSMPYCWGGFSSLTQFKTGLLNGKSAGDNCDPYGSCGPNGAGPNCAVGVDCSGLISRCWKQSSKKGTYTLQNISKPYSSLTKVKAGDVLNSAGWHVRLVSKYNTTSGIVDVIEAVQTPGKVVAKSYTPMQLSWFKPRYYKYVTGSYYKLSNEEELIDDESEETALNYELYPSPVETGKSIKITNAQNLSTIEIIDLTGKTIAVKDMKSESFEKELGIDLPSGIYLLKLNSSSSKSVVKKLIVQ